MTGTAFRSCRARPSDARRRLLDRQDLRRVPASPGSRATPDKLALLAYRADRAEGRRLTYAELGDLVSRAAASLKRLGIGAGDVVSVQLPNWWEFAVVTLAAFRIGAVVNPLMPIFRERELSYMLDFAETKVLVVPKLVPRLRS